ncbi:MAG TPA: hypothetical protein VGR28_13095, partial [Candidatus Thermoplasmatota archaeon]|nr:hypothetical protein [Candidatus Thermoplasmatota archaeon]
GIRALGTLGALSALAIPFVVLANAWRFDIGEAGINIAVTVLATSALPFSPLPGNGVWRWSKLWSLLCVVVTFVLYFGYQLALMPLSVITALGLVGAVGYVAVYLWLHRARPLAALLAELGMAQGADAPAALGDIKLGDFPTRGGDAP